MNFYCRFIHFRTCAVIMFANLTNRDLQVSSQGVSLHNSQELVATPVAGVNPMCQSPVGQELPDDLQALFVGYVSVEAGDIHSLLTLVIGHPGTGRVFYLGQMAEQHWCAMVQTGEVEKCFLNNFAEIDQSQC